MLLGDKAEKFQIAEESQEGLLHAFPFPKTVAQCLF